MFKYQLVGTGKDNVVEQGNLVDLQEGFGPQQNNQQLVPFAVFAQQVIDQEIVEAPSEPASPPFSTTENTTSTE
uniref:Uncharacterized protein n=1 Tax=Meloidogyne enterolobii TaxID=390850 RepID=A0A6V7YCS3_MELEN|nr:unnamed protein product [Meloidogyne enterolobii]